MILLDGRAVGASFLDNESSGWERLVWLVERVVSALSGFVVEEIP